jgi:DNA invertase Pin-like site-specific DNA recombinase/2-hydroxychromene-2-carboxylate isomerase
MTAKVPIRRCAVYTRKSSEEGLEQDFNSLHAQREAGEAFIRSQRGEGWRLIETAYDDGGLSGSTLERPGLQRLFADITQHRVDTVVVYKVDRLTRSLMDFAKVVELFDRHGVTFVAVTQQFNTTTSMGRLTLNILLSFAQFEREVIGERVRDKIAASKKKGMWMGGVTPLGYVIKDRKLVAVPDEAETVRLIFRRYEELGSVRLLKQDLDQQGIRSKQRIYGNGSRAGGQPLSRGALYVLLSNPVYIGEIAHKGDQLRAGAPDRHGPATSPRSPLLGKVFDEAGHRLTPSHATKAGRRYRYYVSRPLVTDTAEQNSGAWRIPATQLENLIATEAATMLAEPAAIAAVLETAGLEPEKVPAALAMADRIRDDLGRDAARGEALAAVVNRIELSPIRLRVILTAGALVPANPEILDPQGAVLVRDVPLRIKRRGVEMRFVIEGPSASPTTPDPVLLKEIRRAHRCFEALVSGQVRSVAELATVEGISDRYVSSLLPLAFLAPDIVEAIAAGRHPPELTAHRLIRTVDLPIAWAAQKQLLGLR